MSIFILVATTHFIALLSPGPDFFLLLTTLLSDGRRAAHAVCVGIALGNAIILLSILYVLHHMGGLDSSIVQIVKYCAAAYLSYLALRCFMALRRVNHRQTVAMQAAFKPHGRTTVRYFYLGLQSSLFNPKNMIFYSSVLLLVYTQFNLWQQLGLALWMVAVVYVWNCMLLKLLSRASYLQYLQAKVGWIYAISAICFLTFAFCSVYLL